MSLRYLNSHMAGGLSGLLMPLLVLAASQASAQSLDLTQRVEELKQEVIALDRDLQALEETVLFPANTRTHVFLSVDVGTFFDIDAVKVKIDDRVVAQHLYSDRERRALIRGAAQELYVGNLEPGRHDLTVIVTGIGPQAREYRIGHQYAFAKANKPKYLELKLADAEQKHQPQLMVNEW